MAAQWRGANIAAGQSKRAPGWHAPGLINAAQTICKPTRATCEKGASLHRPDVLGAILERPATEGDRLLIESRLETFHIWPYANCCIMGIMRIKDCISMALSRPTDKQMRLSLSVRFLIKGDIAATHYVIYICL